MVPRDAPRHRRQSCPQALPPRLAAATCRHPGPEARAASTAGRGRQRELDADRALRHRPRPGERQPASQRTDHISCRRPRGARAYVGAANGGVWFSGDAGSNWNPLDDYAVSPLLTSAIEADSLAVGAIAVQFGATASTDLIYVGTGEANNNLDAYFGIGVKRSASGGAPGSWTLEGANLAGRGFFRVVIDPDDPTLVLAATTSGVSLGAQRPPRSPPGRK